jgi:carbon monoxide dehydrogenase subunit G
MMWMLLAALSWAAETSPNADVTVSRRLAVPPERVMEHLSQPSKFAFTAPDDCLRGVQPIGEVVQGPGALFEVVVLIEGWRRKLRARVTVADVRRVEWDHEGNRGFITRFGLAPADGGGTDVTVTTYIEAPPRPFQRYYFRRVQPAWRECYVRFLDRVGTAEAGS